MHGNIYKTGIVIPCYNEATRLNKGDILEFSKNNENVNLLLVDDGSKDETYSLINELAENNASIDAMSLKKNVGKAEAVRIGINKLIEKQCNYVGYFDADFSTPLKYILVFERLLDNPEKSFTVVMGARIRRLGAHIKRKPIRHIIGRVFATLASISLKLPVYDTQCGAKLFRADIAAEVFNKGFLSKWLFDVEIIARIIIKYGTPESQKRFYEYPLEFWEDDGNSRIKFRDFIKMPFSLLRVHLHYNKYLK
jgi:glycosyltransferase involved in cell wall biosynthesis